MPKTRAGWRNQRGPEPPRKTPRDDAIAGACHGDASRGISACPRKRRAGGAGGGGCYGAELRNSARARF